MHIKPADRDAAVAGASYSGRQLKEPSSVRKVRLGGGAVRVPSNKETTDSPLRVFVSAIGHSIGVRTPLRKQSTPASIAKNEAASCSTPASSKRMANSTTASSRTPLKPSTSGRVPVIASTPKRSSASTSNNSTSSISTSTPAKKQSPLVTSSQTPVSRKPSSASSSVGSTARSTHNPTTPIVKKGSTMPPRTPTGPGRTQNNPTTPISRYSTIPTPAKKQGALSTPISKQATTPVQRKQVHPTTPITRQTSVHPTTPVNGYSNARTPLSIHGSNIPFYTPKTTLQGKSSLPSPLHPRDTNLPSESSRRLHFGINLSAMAEQENMGLCTPRAYSSGTVDPTYSFDKNRLAQIKARRNAFQKLLSSPAQRVRVPGSTQPSLTPHRSKVGRVNPESADDQENEEATGTHSPARRRVANSLF